MKIFMILLLVMVIFVISITLGANNDQVVNFSFLIAQGEYRLSTLLACLFGGGFVLGWLICGIFYLRVSFKLSSAQRKLKKLEQQYASLPDKATSTEIKS